MLKLKVGRLSYLVFPHYFCERRGRLNMGKIDIGIVMGYVLDSGVSEDTLEEIIPYKNMLRTSSISKQDLCKLAIKIGQESPSLMKKNQRRNEGIKHNFDPKIFDKRVKELGWTDRCLNSVCSHASNVIRNIRNGLAETDTLFNYELVNICFMLECDPLFLRGYRKEPSASPSIYVVPRGRFKNEVFKKIDSGNVISLFSENVGLSAIGISKSDDPFVVIDKIALELKKFVGCSTKYAYTLLTNNPKVPAFIMNKLIQFTKSSEDEITYNLIKTRSVNNMENVAIVKNLKSTPRKENVSCEKNQNRITRKEFLDEIQGRIQTVNDTKESSNSGSSFIDRLFQILDLLADYPEFANIVRQLLVMSEEKQKKAIALLSSAFDLLSE